MTLIFMHFLASIPSTKRSLEIFSGRSVCKLTLRALVPFDIVPQEVMQPCIEGMLLHPGTAGRKVNVINHSSYEIREVRWSLRATETGISSSLHTILEISFYS